MPANLSNYKVIYDEKVLNAIALMDIRFADGQNMDDQYKKPKFIEVMAINSDGNIICIRDEAWRFQFVPRMARGND